MINRYINSSLLIIFTLAALNACFKEDDRITKPDIDEIRIELLPEYTQQVYFRLYNKSVVAQNNIYDWDLAFSCDTGSFSIYLNSGLYMLAHNTNDTVFDKEYSTKDIIWKWDDPSGVDSMNALYPITDDTDENMSSTKNIFLIDRGKNVDGSDRGIVKFQLVSVDSLNYHIRFDLMDETQTLYTVIHKDTSRNVIHFSFDNNKTHLFEPEKKEWDLLFTRYMHIFRQGDEDAPRSFNTEFLPYLVTGVLINTSGVEVVKDSKTGFNAIDILFLENYTFSSKRNFIGWNWKEYKNDEYIVDDKRTYIINGTDNAYYKLRFTDFYFEGVKGYPAFIIEKLY